MIELQPWPFSRSAVRDGANRDQDSAQSLSAPAQGRAGQISFRECRTLGVAGYSSGDAFNGGLAVGLSAELGIAAAIRWGMAAGALSVTRSGAQPSMPGREEVLELMEQGS